ncbi:MAG: hypothetical protein KJO07_00225, partial [Deltaproteobacteria bacterium]|nr:hypothetical protein [Deltaproteobacteria bacterium]
RLEAAVGAERTELRAELDRVTDAVRAEKTAEVAEEFDGVHNVQRAREVGAVHEIIAPSQMRPYLIEAVERGIAKALAKA